MKASLIPAARIKHFGKQGAGMGLCFGAMIFAKVDQILGIRCCWRWAAHYTDD